TLTTDKSGNASVSGLYPGKYYVKEITPPAGYVLDEEEHDVEGSYEGDQVKEIDCTITVAENVKKQPFQLMICPLSSRQVKYLKVSDKNTYISFWSVGIFMHTISLYIF
nr:prealbumin-like fold domain-containing protein [Phocaeicola vulgatus]